jgi:gas vesicle protein
MEDHTMSGSDTVPVLITGGAAIAGALAGGAIGGFSTWAGIHRSGKDSRDDRRRAAYAAFIAAQEELRRILLAWRTAEPSPAPDARFGPAIAQAVGSVDRAFVAVVLAGPRKAKDHADDVRDQAWGVYNVIYRPEGTGQSADPKLGKRVEKYIDACDAFSRTASEVLGTR